MSALQEQIKKQVVDKRKQLEGFSAYVRMSRSPLSEETKEHGGTLMAELVQLMLALEALGRRND